MNLLLGFSNHLSFLLDAGVDAKEGYIFTMSTQNWVTLGFQWVNTIILAVVLTLILYKPVKDFLRKRSERIKNQLDAAEADMRDATELKAKYEDKLKGIDTERNEILETARKRALEKGEQLIAEARKEADTIRTRAASDIEMEKEKVKDEMKKEIIEISTAMASRFVASSIDTATQSKIFDETIKDLGDVKWQN